MSRLGFSAFSSTLTSAAGEVCEGVDDRRKQADVAVALTSVDSRAAGVSTALSSTAGVSGIGTAAASGAVTTGSVAFKGSSTGLATSPVVACASTSAKSGRR